jgi:hypothetical protein
MLRTGNEAGDSPPCSNRKYPQADIVRGCLKSPLERIYHCGLDPQSPENQCPFFRESCVKRGMTGF